MDLPRTIFVKCNDCSVPAREYNKRFAEIEDWLTKNIGDRWEDWDWSGVQFGVVMLPIDHPATTQFVLKYRIHTL